MTERMKEDIRKACEVLRQGGVILYPTDTVWGIGCDATNEKAVSKVFEIKRREERKAMLVLVDNPVKVSFFVKDVPSVAWDLIDLAASPLTIIYEGAKGLAPNLMGEDGTIGIRVTKEEFSRQLCYHFRGPIVSTSANISGEPAPALFREISDEIINAVDYVAVSRRQEKIPAKPSGIIRLSKKGEVKVLRR